MDIVRKTNGFVHWKASAFWILLWLVQSLLMSAGSDVHFYLAKNTAIVGLQFLVVQVNLKWLFPLFFETRRYFLYILLSIALVYLAFSFSFLLIDLAFSLFMDIRFAGESTSIFTFDFWRILSGSSFYSLALVCSSIYALLRSNKEKDNTNQELKAQLDRSVKPEFIVIKEGRKTHQIPASDILYIKGLKEYVVWYTKGKSIVALQTLNSIESEYQDFGFLRIHKSYIVNVNNVDLIESNQVKINGDFVPIGRAYKKKIKFLM